MISRAVQRPKGLTDAYKVELNLAAVSIAHVLGMTLRYSGCAIADLGVR